MQKRPFILWACAVILGVAAGFNWQRMRSTSGTSADDIARSIDMESADDFERIESLAKKPFRDVSDDDIRLIEKYAYKKSKVQGLVFLIMDGAASDAVAKRLAPILNKVYQDNPRDELLLRIPSRWRKNGVDPIKAGLSIPEK